jgi:hypothetical protein
MLWEITLMRRLFKGDDDLTTLRLAASGQIERPTKIDPSYPRELEDIVMSALERKVENRMESAGALAAALRSFLSDKVIEHEELGGLVRRLFPEESARLETFREGTMSSALTHAQSGTAGFARPVVAPASVSSGPPAVEVNLELSHERTVSETLPRSRMMFSTAAVAALFALTLVGVKLSTRHTQDVHAADAPRATARAPVVLPPSEPLAKEIVVTSEPHGARHTLDGMVIEGARVAIPADGKLHRLEVRADGYESMIRTVDENAPSEIHFALKPLPKKHESRSKRAAQPSGKSAGPPLLNP